MLVSQGLLKAKAGGLSKSQKPSALIWATVNIVDTRAMLRVDIGVYLGTILWVLLESICRTHVLLAYQ